MDEPLVAGEIVEVRMAADEQRLTVRGRYAAWTIAQEGIVSSVQYADLRGEP